MPEPGHRINGFGLGRLSGFLFWLPTSSQQQQFDLTAKQINHTKMAHNENQNKETTITDRYTVCTELHINTTRTTKGENICKHSNSSKQIKHYFQSLSKLNLI